MFLECALLVLMDRTHSDAKYEWDRTLQNGVIKKQKTKTKTQVHLIASCFMGDTCTLDPTSLVNTKNVKNKYNGTIWCDWSFDGKYFSRMGWPGTKVYNKF